MKKLLKNSESYLFIFYILLFGIVAASIALAQPLKGTDPFFADPPDEFARFMVPEFICKYGKIPTGFEEEIRIPGYGFSYGLYNTFPYIVMGYVMRFFSLFTDSRLFLLYVARFINVLCGVGMAVTVHAIGKRLFEKKHFKWLFCFAVMFLPQSLFVHTYVNTDSMCMLAVSLILYGLVCAYQDGINYRNALWLCLGIILCALSYYNAYGYILSSILLFVAYFYNGTRGKFSYDYKGMLKWGTFIAGIVLVGISWWFIRSYILYDGDFLGLATREKCAMQYAVSGYNPLNMNTYRDKGYSVTQMIKETYFFDGLFETFVGAYGCLTIRGNIWMYHFYKAFLYAGILGYVVLIWKNMQKHGFKRIFFHINMIFCMLMPIVLTIYYSYTMDFQNQGRYIMPMIVPLMYYSVKGFERIRNAAAKIPEKPVVAACAVCMAAIAGILLVFVYGYAFPIYMETGMTL